MQIPESVLVLTVELLILSLLWCGIMLLNTSVTQVAAWPQLLFWSTALTLGAIGLQLLAMLANVSRDVLIICVSMLQCAVVYLFSNTVTYFVLSVGIFTLFEDEQKWLHGVLYEPGYRYNENIWVSQLKFILFTVMSCFGVLLGVIIVFLVRSVILDDNNAGSQGKVEQALDVISERLQAGGAWGRYLRLHYLGLVLLSDCLARYLTRVCNDADTIRSNVHAENQNSHCFFTPLDIPAISDNSSPSTQALEYSAFVLLNFVCDIMVQQRFGILTRSIATSVDYGTRSNTRKPTHMPSAQSKSMKSTLSNNRSSAYIIVGIRSVQFAVLLILLLVYMEQRISVISEYLSVLIVLVLLLTIYTDFRDLMLLFKPIDTKKVSSVLRKVLPANDGELPSDSSSALAFRYDVIDPGHAPGSVYMRTRLGLKME